MIPGANLVILGRQGSGKGTQAVRLANHYVIAHISTGDIFREAAESGTELGGTVKSLMDEGELVPDDVVIEVVRERVGAADTRLRGFILDGFPRTVGQAEALEEMLEPRGIDVVIDLEVPTALVLDRLARRRVCVRCKSDYSPQVPPVREGVCDLCGSNVVHRDDDTTAAIARRLQLYEERTQPLVDWYTARDKLVVVDGVGSPADITARAIEAIDARD